MEGHSDIVKEETLQMVQRQRSRIGGCAPSMCNMQPLSVPLVPKFCARFKAAHFAIKNRPD